MSQTLTNTYTTSSEGFFQQFNNIIINDAFTVKAFCPSD